jgi:hypothetical protein
MNTLKELLMKVNHTVYTTVIVAATLGLVAFVLHIGQTDLSQVITMFTGIMFNVAIFLAVVFSLQFFQFKIGTDIQQEIYEENNTAAAIYQGLIFVSIAIVISKGLM